MKTFNSVVIEGNIVDKPVLNFTTKGTPICHFLIKVNNFLKKGNRPQDVSCFNVEAWAELAKLCTTKGLSETPVRIVGRFKQDRWIGFDGKNHSKIKIIAEHVEFKFF